MFILLVRRSPVLYQALFSTSFWKSLSNILISLQFFLRLLTTLAYCLVLDNQSLSHLAICRWRPVNFCQALWFPRLGHKRLYSFHLVLLGEDSMIQRFQCRQVIPDESPTKRQCSLVTKGRSLPPDDYYKLKKTNSVCPSTGVIIPWYQLIGPKSRRHMTIERVNAC